MKKFYDFYTDIGINDNNSIIQQKNETGSGKMICFDIVPGIKISYNCLNMNTCYRPIVTDSNFLQIDHCKEGCYEFEMSDGYVSFLGEGDLSVSSFCKGRQSIVGSRIPLKKYQGITILFEIEKAQKSLNSEFSLARIDLNQIKENLCSEGRSLLIKSKYEIDHIFRELYHVNDKIRIPYFFIKVIELLLFLSLLDKDNVKPPQQFSDEISERVKKAYQYIIEHPFEKITVRELADRYCISESSMKRCFTSIAGTSIGAFIKNKKMEAAAELIAQKSNISICEVAELAGYENQSIFSAAFKSVFGIIPYDYKCKTH